ncbi:MAG: type VI secretion system tip protein VgrG [Bacteroidaceae bacterium]|nr:type VI secretion system tip protein VgrG [Bacteroidaceae bacterium]
MAESNKTYEVNNTICTKIVTDGKEIDCSQFIVSVKTTHEFHKIATAEITLEDGDLFDEDFVIGNADTFLVGKEIEINVGYDEPKECIFKGRILKQSIQLGGKNNLLVITAKHDAFKLTLNRQFRNFEDQTDSDAIESICGDQGISCEIDSCSVQHEKLVQYNCTDWDFINMRAEVNGLLLCNVLDGITAKVPDLSADPVILINNGTNINKMQAELDGRFAFETYESKAWNYTGQAYDEGSENGGQNDTAQGDIDSKSIASKMGLGSHVMQKLSAQENPDAMNAWAKTISMRNDLSRIVGKISISGFAPIMPGDMVELTNIGRRFNGKTLVSSVTQTITSGCWETTLGIGFDNTSFVEKYNDISSMPADGLLPNTNGLQIAKVDALEGDPLGEERICVKLMASEESKIWARVATLDAGNGRGSAFMPEIDDEVIVGFVNDDPTQAIVLGMMHSSSAPSPYEKKDDNNLKGFVTREKLKLEFDDEKKALTLETPGGNKVCISDDAKGISLTDRNGNTITLNDQGVTIESKKALTLKATQDLSIEGMNINGKANAQLKWEGTASAEFSASGNTVIKGGIVQIN